MKSRTLERTRQWPGTEVKNRISFNTTVPRIDNDKIGAAVQILETFRFIFFRDDSFTRGQSNMRRFIYERSATNIRDWSLAYSFTCKVVQNSVHICIIDNKLLIMKVVVIPYLLSIFNCQRKSKFIRCDIMRLVTVPCRGSSKDTRNEGNTGICRL